MAVTIAGPRRIIAFVRLQSLSVDVAFCALTRCASAVQQVRQQVFYLSVGLCVRACVLGRSSSLTCSLRSL